MFAGLIYAKSPIFLQNIFISFRALLRKSIRDNSKNGKLFCTLISLERDEKSLLEYSTEQLSNTLSQAIINTKIYSNKKADINNFSFIDKLDIQQEPNAFLNKKHKGPTVTGSTSGTTGSPLTIPQNLNSVLREQAFVSRYLKWAGFNVGDKRAWLRGEMIVPINQEKAPFWRYSYFEDMILLSSFHMTVDALPKYIEAMVKFKVDIIQAYPSSIVTLAKHLQTKGEYYPGTLKSIITSSESLSKEDKKLVEERFNCTVFDWYGLFERVAAIASCEYGRYHILTDYSHVELLPAGEVDGKQRAEIVGTNYNNSLYPLIRYKTGDHVILTDEQGCACGRVFPVVDLIEGRKVSPLYTSEGTAIYALDQCTKGVEGILGAQYIQHRLNEIEVHVIPNGKFTLIEEEKLTNNVKIRFGSDANIILVKVNSLQRTKNGKTIQAICNIENTL